MKTPKGKPRKRGPAKREVTKSGKGKRKRLQPVANPTPEDVIAIDTATAETMAPVVRRAMELRGFKFQLWEIAETLHREFKLNRCPSEATVWRWINEAMQAYASDIKAFAAREVAEQLHTTELLLRTWLPRAADELEIRRTRIRNGVTVEEIDEKAYDEKLKAVSIVDKMLAARRDLLGIKDGGGLPQEGEGKKTTDQLHQYLLKLATEAVSALPSANAKPATAKPVLELESGFTE